MQEMYRSVTSNGARTLGLEGYGLAVGCQADLVVLQARDEIEALRLRPARLRVYRRGKLLASAPEEISTVYWGDNIAEVDFSLC